MPGDAGAPGDRTLGAGRSGPPGTIGTTGDELRLETTLWGVGVGLLQLVPTVLDPS